MVYRNPIRILFATTTIAALVVAASAQDSKSVLTSSKIIPLENVRGRIDHLACDVAGQRLFVAALGNDTVEVVDLKEGKDLRSLSGFAEPQGIAYVPELNRLFIANGQDGSCRILEGHSFKTIASVPLGDDADNVRYDDRAKRIYVGYGAGALGTIDAQSGAKLDDIKLSGHPESFRLATDSPRIYVNIPQAGEIAIVDRDRGGVLSTWPLKAARANFPMALDQAHARLFVGCRNPAEILVYNTANGELVTQSAIAADTDDLHYDPRRNLIYASCGAGTLEVIRQVDADHYPKIQVLNTLPGARTSLFVPELDILCVAAPRRSGEPAKILVYALH